ncbi:hypothetical protein EK599_08095 [Vibrio sp. T187]|uniref:DUF1992 domain-containing protein n=1 Tax=Vibrio TaxID=662 RepID=UPI0010C9F180|nr:MULTISPECIES: DUF1992 domain-containing protein [Vibrio]MBW3695653.1 hypothetical protein [Vibrio sp. T187]
MNAIDIMVNNQIKLDAENSKENKFKGKAIDLTVYFRSPKESRAVNRYLRDQGFTPTKIQLMNKLAELKQTGAPESEIQAIKLKIELED